MASEEVDPRYAARYQRGFDPDAQMPTEDAAPALLIVAGVLVVAAASSVIWVSLDPGFASAARTPPGPGLRAVVAAAPGPLLVGSVVALAAWVRSGVGRRSALVATFGGALLIIGALAAVASEVARLAGLTAQGPVSSGGIPLPDEALVTYQLRVQTLGALLDLMPWLVLAATLALIAGLVSCRTAGSGGKV